MFKKIRVVFRKPGSSRRVVKSRALLRCRCGKRAHLQCIEVTGLCAPCFCVFASCKSGHATHGYLCTYDTMESIEDTVIAEWNEIQDGDVFIGFLS